MTRRTLEASFLYTQTPERPPLAAVTRSVQMWYRLADASVLEYLTHAASVPEHGLVSA